MGRFSFSARVFCHLGVLSRYDIHVPDISLQYVPKPRNRLSLLLQDLSQKGALMLISCLNLKMQKIK